MTQALDRPHPRRITRLLLLCLLTGLGLVLLPLRGVAVPAQGSEERVRKERKQEIEQVLGRLEEEDLTVEYLLYVVLPVIGLMGMLLLVRRLLQP